MDLRLYYLHRGRLHRTGNGKKFPMFHPDKHYFENIEDAERHINGMENTGWYESHEITQYFLLEYTATNSYKNNTKLIKTFNVKWKKKPQQ